MSASETGKAQSTAVVEKKQDKQSLVDLKNGKVLFKQKPLSLEKQSETLQEIVKFRDMLEERIKNGEPPLKSFPDEYKPLIAKLAHESDKTLAALTKYVHQQLLPTLEDDDADAAAAATTVLPPNVVEKAIEQVLTRNNYGLDLPAGTKISASISVWRWEISSDHMDWLPKNSREKAETRHLERIQAKEDLKSLFEALSLDERNAILDPKGAGKLPAKELNKPTPPQSSDTKTNDAKATPQSKKQGKQQQVDEPENDNNKNKTPRPKKAQDPEKAAKEKERLEKKAARLEKEKKEKDAHNKSQSIMANFFVKPAKAIPQSKTVQESAIAGPSRIQSDFKRTFKPFVLQKDKTLAPSNWFLAEKKRKRRAMLQAPNKNEVIVIDSEEDSDIEMLEPQPSEQELGSMSVQARLKDILSSLPTPLSTRNVVRKKGFKAYHPISVRDLASQLSEAEISGNDELVRSILAQLSDRDTLPAKAFCFHTDARPGYFGTWTRSSRIIGPRTPFAKDSLIFDYTYDSGEEWEEEAAGEDVAEDNEEEDGDAEERDSDLDSWLVDDDEEPDPEMSGNSSPPPFDLLTAPIKRKAEEPEKKTGKKRKLVVPLVPFVKGPMHETTIGQCEYEPFRPYAIQLFNDTPSSIDPFTFVSTCIEDYKRSLTAPKTNNISNAPDSNVFVVPALPSRLTASKASAEPLDISTNTHTQGVIKKLPAAPKAPFPDAHLDLLLTKITQLQAGSITSLVESIYLDLREYKVKKVAIEAKVREVGEKCKDKKVWIIKPNLLLVPQTPISNT